MYTSFTHVCQHAIHDPKFQLPHATVSKIVRREWHKFQNVLMAELKCSLKSPLM